MNIFFKICSIMFFLLLSNIACVSELKEETPDIYYKWMLQEIIYEDGSNNYIDKGNFVLIEKDYIQEIIKECGVRRYPYYRKKNILYVTSGEALITWEIHALDSTNLQLKTPLGIYVLKRTK